jgi:hypothetical protein
MSPTGRQRTLSAAIGRWSDAGQAKGAAAPLSDRRLKKSAKIPTVTDCKIGLFSKNMSGPP